MTTTANKKSKQKKQNDYVCSFCNKTFLRESAFIDHVCVPMQRHQKMKTSEGVAAWMAYSTWIKSMGKKVPPQSGFLTSRFYQSFIKFAEFVRSVKTLDVEQYVRYMVKLDIPPVIWTHDAIYEEWVRVTSIERSPIKNVQLTTLFLLNYCDKHEIDISAVFQHITCPQLTEWIKTSTVSPWFLLGSVQFKSWMKLLDDDEKRYLTDVLNPSEWMEKIKSNPNTMTKIKQIVAELGL